MKNIIGIIFLFLSICSTSSWASINEIHNLDQFEAELESADKNVLVILDVDNTLLVPNDSLFRPCCEHVLRRLLQMVNLGGRSRADYLESQCLLDMKIDLVDPKMPGIIKNAQQKGIKCMALTAMKSGTVGAISSMEDWRYDQLKEKDFDFSISFSPNTYLLLDEYDSDQFLPTFKHGVLTSGKYAKGKVLASFLERLEFRPSKIIFIDDNLQCLQSVENEMKKLGIECSAYHYLAVNALPCTFDIDLIKFQCQYLLTHERWLSDEEARSIMQLEF